MENASILEIQEKFTEADAIKSYQYNEYLPTSGSNLNVPGTITINIESQDEFYHPRKCMLLVEGDLLKKADDTRFGGSDQIALASNGIMHLFSNFKYEIAGQEIENINEPGIAGVMMGMAKFPYTFALGTGMMQCWCPQTMDTTYADRAFQRRREYILTKSKPKGSFSFILELENTSGFVEDYDKVVYGMRHKITLVRKSDDDAIMRAKACDAGKVKLTKIAWLMPRVHASDVKKFDLYRTIESKSAIDVGFRMRQCNVAEIPKDVTNFDWRLGVRSAPEKPRHILIAFQIDRNGNQEKNPSLFDNVDVSQVSVILNDTKYPARDVIADFEKHKYVEYYKMFTDFSREYYGLDPLTCGNFVDMITYKEEYPIFYFDVSKQSERLNDGVVDIMVRMRFKKGTPEHVRAHALIISDRRMKFQSDGKKMNIIY